MTKCLKRQKARRRALAKLTARTVFPILAVALKSETVEDEIRMTLKGHDAGTRASIWALFELERDRYDLLADALEER